MRWRSADCGDADGLVGREDAFSNGMIGVVVEFTMSDGKDMVVLRARLVGVNNAMAEAALWESPQLHAPKVKPRIPKLKPFTDMVRLPSGVAKIVIEQGGNDLRIILGLLQKRRYFPRFSLIADHQVTQIIGRIGMKRQAGDNTKFGIACQSELPPSRAVVGAKQRASSASNVAWALAVAVDCWDWIDRTSATRETKESCKCKGGSKTGI